jgi:hypothetical protein
MNSQTDGGFESCISSYCAHVHNKVRLTNITLQFLQNISAAAATLVPTPKLQLPVNSAALSLISSRVLLFRRFVNFIFQLILRRV